MDSMGQRLPWLVAMTLAGASTAHAAAPADAAIDGPEAPAIEEPPAMEEPPATEEPATPPAEGTATEATSEPSTPSPAPTPETIAPPTEPDRPLRTYPRLVLAGGPVVGPHALGNEECNYDLGRCETKGSFIGTGVQLEVRARLWKIIYAHARGLVVGNVSPNDRIHRGLWGVGVGVGLMGRRVFGRAEYLFLDTFGDNHFEPPFYDGEVASDEWGHHAGMLSVGFRQPLPKGVAAELWGGLVIGPHSVRRVPDIEPDERVLTTFLVGLNVSWDAWR